MAMIFNEFNPASRWDCNLAAFEHIGIPWSSIVFPSVRDV